LRNAPEERDYYRNHDQKKWRDELLLRITYREGLRINEALDLQYPYNFKKEDEQGYVLLNPEEATHKTEEGVQPVGADLISVSNYMTAFHQDLETNFLFTIKRSRAYQIVNELRGIVGIEKKLGTHTLRRSRAKHLYEDAGWEIERVSNFLRHDDTATTEILEIRKEENGRRCG
jgi:integrase/recombinase XerD